MDRYLDLVLKRDAKSSDLVVSLLEPLHVNKAKNLYISLCSMSYIHDSNAYKNCPVAVFEIACPRFTWVPDPNPGPGYGSTGRVTKFVHCRLENSEYSPSTLASALNREISAKFTSDFLSKAIDFGYNSDIDRFEISIDGSHTLYEDDRCTLIVYWPLSKHLGFTQLEDRSASYCFGSACPPKVSESMISKTSHAIANFPPKLPRPLFIHWFLNCLEQQQHKNEIRPLLASLKRPALPAAGKLIEHNFEPGRYKRIDSNLSLIREFRFQVQDEHRKDFKAFHSMSVTLHILEK